MHDSFLMQNLSKTLEIICRANHIEKIRKIHIVMDIKNKVEEQHIFEHLLDLNPELVGETTDLEMVLEDIGEGNIIIPTIEGDLLE